MNRIYQLFTEVFFKIKCFDERFVDKPVIPCICCFSLPHFIQGSFALVDEYVGSGELTPIRKLSGSGTTVVAGRSFFVHTPVDPVGLLRNRILRYERRGLVHPASPCSSLVV